MKNNLTEHVQSIGKGFEEKYTWQRLGYMSNVASDMMVKELKSHLLLSQLKTIELAKESFEKRVKNNETKSDDYALGYDKGLQEVITLLDTIIQKIKSQIK